MVTTKGSENRSIKTVLIAVIVTVALALSGLGTALALPESTITVKYCGEVNKIDLNNSGNSGLSVIDTSGKNLPKNGVKPSVKYLSLGSNGSIVKRTTVEDLFTKNFSYSKSPSLKSITKDIRGYKLDSVRVDGTSYSSDVLFTYDSDQSGDGYVYIPEGAEIKLNYLPSEEKNEKEIPTDFYDYDITDGYIYTSRLNALNQTNKINTSKQNTTTTYYVNTITQGINDLDNYSGEGAKMAFGNLNTGTTLDYEKLSDGTLLNRYNSGSGSGYNGRAFGLVEGHKNGDLVYVDNIDAPNYFDGKAIGKTHLDGSLTYKQTGTSFSLTSASVEKETTTDLDKFNNQAYATVFTNDYWPVDNVSTHATDGHDLKFGSSTDATKRKCISSTSTTSKNLPAADDALDHNYYYGSKHSVDFDLDEEYVGPIDYFYYGQEEAYVFLDDTLVLDLGGTGSNTSEYVNLRDYLPIGDSGKHTLSVYSMNRAGSGSTYYEYFNLPVTASDSVDPCEINGHTEYKVQPVAATCTEDGCQGYYGCSVCGKIFSDPDLKNETTLEELTIQSEGHQYFTIPGYPADCTNPGLTDSEACSFCSEVAIIGEVIPPLRHDPETIYGYPATETEAGMTDGERCCRCGEIFVQQEIIPPTGTNNSAPKTSFTLAFKATGIQSTGFSNYKEAFVALNN